MRRVVPSALLLLLALLLAGCTDSAVEEQDAEVPLDVPVEPTTDAVLEPTVATTPVNWTHSLTRGAWICGQTGCHFAPSEDVYNAVQEIPLASGNVSGGSLSLSWQPTSQVTDALTFGFRIYNPNCDACEGRYNTEISGGSPLQVLLSPDMYVEQGDVLRLWVYGAMIEGEATSGTYVGLSDDQQFVVEGEVVTVQ